VKVALVHDWLTGLRGGERCLEAFLRIYPQADVYTLIHVPEATSPLIDAQVKQASFLQKFPAVRKYYRLLLPLYPAAIKSLRIDGYDLVISLSHSAAKNVVVPKNTFHICYCFTPMRYIWDQAESYFGKLTPLVWPILKSLRNWDVKGAERPDAFVAISRFVAARIRCFYGRDSEVIYPPVDTSWISSAASKTKGVAFLYAGALVPYKRPDLVVEAFNKLEEPLWIVGRGPMESQLRKLAKHNVTFFGHVPDSELANFYRKSRALIFPGVEDFGMVPIECLAAGRPVIGLFDGALRETILGVRPWSYNSGDPIIDPLEGIDTTKIMASHASGVFIEKKPNAGRQAEIEALCESVKFFISKESEISVESCVRRAEHFSPMRFYRAWNELLVRRGLLPGWEERKKVVGLR